MSEEKPKICQYCARWERLIHNVRGGLCKVLKPNRNFKKPTESCMLWTDGKKN